MMSDFAPEVAKYTKSSPKSQNSTKQCASLLSHSISDAACLVVKTYVDQFHCFCIGQMLCPLHNQQCEISKGAHSTASDQENHLHFFVS